MSTFSKFWDKYGSWCYSAEAGVAEIAETAINFGENELIRRIEVLELRENDIIVLSYDGKLTEVAHNRLKESFANATCLKNHKVIVLEEGIEISALRPTAAIEDDSDF